jgi:hypothetical protein
MEDRRKRPWKKLRVVVEVSIPPTSRALEKDLKFLVEDALPKVLGLPRPMHNNAIEAVVRVKGFLSFLPVYLRQERDKSKRKDKSNDDPYNGL